MNNRTNANDKVNIDCRISMKKSVIVPIFLSIFLALSGMAAIALADSFPATNIFRGNVTLNGDPATTGMTIDAYIDEELRGSSTIVTDGEYYKLEVTGNVSEDGGKLITFKVCGATVDQTGIEWHPTLESRTLDLTATDNEAPAVTNTDANPASIDPDGAETSELTVTVIDGCSCNIDFVTVDLSAIGGSDAQEMTRIGDTDVYTVITNASEGTAIDTYCLPVNASDVFGNYEDGVCIDLEVTSTTEYDSADTNQDCVVGPMELMTQIGKWKSGEVGPMELMTSIARWKLGTGGYC